MRKQLVFIGLMLAVFFINSCAAVGILAGGGTLGCAAYEVSSNERCPALEKIDETLKDS